MVEQQANTVASIYTYYDEEDETDQEEAADLVPQLTKQIKYLNAQNMTLQKHMTSMKDKIRERRKSEKLPLHENVPITSPQISNRHKRKSSMFRNPYSAASSDAQCFENGELFEDDLDESYMSHGVASDYEYKKLNDSFTLFKTAQTSRNQTKKKFEIDHMPRRS